jgi:carboxypeptidase Q
MRVTIRVLAVASLISLVWCSGRANPQAPPKGDAWLIQYHKAAKTLISAARADSEGWRRLEHLCLQIGPRLCGSPAYDAAVRWAAGLMRKDGLSVSTPPVMTPHWERGLEEAEILSPTPRKLAALGLGGTVATPPGGITAPVVAVRSFDELQALGESKIRGRIVLFDPEWEGYGKTVAYRTRGASSAARLGAVAVLIRSIGPAGLDVPHTGQISYAPDAPAIPAAALTVSDAQALFDLARSESVTARLRLEDRMLPDSATANVIGDFPGSEFPDQIVLIGAHLDSWDVGQGAHDDGGGCVVAMEAARLISRSGLRPKRTIRVVLWANEENGLRGAEAYRRWIDDTISKHVAAIEIDSGLETPVGFGLGSSHPGNAGYEKALETLSLLSKPLESVGASQILQGGGGADTTPLVREGVPGLSLRSSGKRYFLWHHSPADTFDKLDRRAFARHLAAAVVMCYGLADMPERLDAILNSTAP